jgi:hypothetical protein
MSAPAIVIDRECLRIRFDQFDREAYGLFLQVKRLPEYTLDFEPAGESYLVSAPARFAPMLGVEVPAIAPTPLPLADYLYDDQRAELQLSLDAKRFAIWTDCGLGKGPIALEWSRQVSHGTGGRVLIVTLNEVANQFADEIRKFYGDSLPVRRLNSRGEMRDWCGGRLEGDGERIAITNYEKFNPDDDGQEVPELRMLGGIALDESSRLKTGGGKQKWALIKSAKGIPYKLSLTATPAPNDTMEFASQAAFLEKMRSEGEIIWTYFTRDPKSHRWAVKKHAREAFFQWMSGWSIYVQNPKRYGWRLNLPEVPKPVIFEHRIGLTEPQREWLFTFNKDEATGNLRMFADKDTNTIQRSKASQIAKGFRYLKGEAGRRVERIESLKPRFVSELIAAERAAGHQVLVWTQFTAETVILAEELARLAIPASEMAVLTGDTPEDRRVEILDGFRRGEIGTLIGRADMIGYGMNFQCCTSMVFSGWCDSFEQWYQAIRRAFRFGQTKSLRVHVPVIPELEGQTFENIMRKQDQFQRDIREMEGNYIRAFGQTGVIGAGGAA